MSDRLQLVVGIGNTTAKFGLTGSEPTVEWPTWSFRQEVSTASLSSGSLTSLDFPDSPVQWTVASVHRGAENHLREWVATHRPSDRYRCLRQSDFPIPVHVDEPERVGLDRLAAAVAVNTLRKAGPAVFVDAGTALTINLVSADGAFEGGVILPGFALTAKALATGTDQLPLVMADLNADPPGLIGKNTTTAIRSGLFWGNVGAVREIVARITEQLRVRPALFVTGGDAQRLARFVAADAHFVPDLVLAGIFFTLSHHRQSTDV